MHRVPDHSTFSQNKKRRFKDAGIFREIFNEVVLKCMELGAVSGETGVADGSFLPSNVSWDSRYEAVETINRSTIKYMEELEAELSSMPGYKKAENVETEKDSLKSRTDLECGYIHQARKKGLGYLAEVTVDTHHGIITGVDCYPANQRESDQRVMRLRQIWAEGTFAVLKQEHKLNKIQKRGIQKATEECLLSATALNLKRLVKAV